ncbi:multidrug effflux MFS transporter [Halopseudomonas salegens]|uniref:Bcr/CflA family efflux transporter n=1 Tax=Halopseudomonas salegens TaxID=1434072 RepID=A0A1H2ERD8_9GAMM|nr:multidrug effflux MFS transporter [Halopseudomonas salegens]SDT97645.1 MFS transporter, DHA1 family, bicyclomycin/chloramphenicol resistance protein [Halopseudomonas salegens]
MPLKILLILGGLSAFGPLAIDLYLPAFPTMARAFATSTDQIQLSLSAYFIGLACGQILYGPVADRFGRRKPLLFGIGLFCSASLLCAFAPTLEWLIAGRFLQALGGCAGMVVTRAVIRDLCSPLEAARAFSKLMLVMGVAPILAPLLGGYLLVWTGWQGIFLFLTLFSAAFALIVLLGLRETLPVDGPRQSMSYSWRSVPRILRDPLFILHALTGGLAMAAMFAYIAGLPFVLIEIYGVAEQDFGWIFGLNAAGFILFAQVNGRLLRRRSPQQLVRNNALLFMGTALALLLASWWQPEQLLPFWVVMFVFVASVAMVLPNATACAMDGYGQQAGMASALLGTLQSTFAAITSALVGWLHDGSALPLGLVVGGCGILVALAALSAAAIQRPQCSTYP